MQENTDEQKIIKKLVCFAFAFSSALIPCVFWLLMRLQYKGMDSLPLWCTQLITRGFWLIALIFSCIALSTLYRWKLNGIIFKITICVLSFFGIVTGTIWAVVIAYLTIVFSEGIPS